METNKQYTLKRIVNGEGEVFPQFTYKTRAGAERKAEQLNKTQENYKKRWFVTRV